MPVEHLVFAECLLYEVLREVLLLQAIDSQITASEVDLPERLREHHFKKEAT